MTAPHKTTTLKHILARLAGVEKLESLHPTLLETTRHLFFPPERPKPEGSKNTPPKNIDWRHELIRKRAKRDEHTIGDVKVIEQWRHRKGKASSATLALAKRKNIWWPLLDRIQVPATYKWPKDTRWEYVLIDALRLERFDVARYAIDQMTPDNRVSSNPFRTGHPEALALFKKLASEKPNNLSYDTPTSIEELDCVENRFCGTNDYTLALRLTLGGLAEFQKRAQTMQPGHYVALDIAAADRPDWLAALLAHPNPDIKFDDIVELILSSGAEACWDYLETKEPQRLANVGPITFSNLHQREHTKPQRPILQVMTKAVLKWPPNHLTWQERSVSQMGFGELGTATTNFLNAICAKGYTITNDITGALSWHEDQTVFSRLVADAKEFSWEATLHLLQRERLTGEEMVAILRKTTPPQNEEQRSRKDRHPYANLEAFPNNDAAARLFLEKLGHGINADEIMHLRGIDQVSDATLKQLIARADLRTLSEYDYRSFFERSDTRLENLIAAAGARCQKPRELIQDLKWDHNNKKRPDNMLPVVKKLIDGVTGLYTYRFLTAAFSSEDLARLGDWVLAAKKPISKKSDGNWQEPDPAKELAELKDWARLRKYAVETKRLQPTSATITAILKEGQTDLAKDILETWPELKDHAREKLPAECYVSALKLGIALKEVTPAALEAKLHAGIPLKNGERHRLLKACRKQLVGNAESIYLGEAPKTPLKTLATLVPPTKPGRVASAWTSGGLNIRFLKQIPANASLDAQIRKIRAAISQIERQSANLDPREFTIQYETGPVRWQKITRQPPPHEDLADQLPLGFNLAEYQAVLTVLRLEAKEQSSTQQGLELLSFRIQIVYGSLEEAAKTLRKSQLWYAKTPWHDLGQFTLPTNRRFTISAWRQILAHHASKGQSLLALAPAIEDKLGRPPKTLKEAEETANLVTYPRADENQQLAQLARAAKLDNDQFEDYLDFLPAHQKLAEGCPHIHLNGADFGDPDLVFEKLASDDPLGPMLGRFTACCQHLHGAASASAKHGYSRPDGAFYVLRKGQRILGESWAWRRNNTLVMDSWESPSPEIGKKYCLPVLTKAAERIKGRLGITDIRLGAGGNTPDLNLPKSPTPVPTPKGYSDAHEQYLLLGGQSAKKPGKT